MAKIIDFNDGKDEKKKEKDDFDAMMAEMIEKAELAERFGGNIFHPIPTIEDAIRAQKKRKLIEECCKRAEATEFESPLMDEVIKNLEFVMALNVWGYYDRVKVVDIGAKTNSELKLLRAIFSERPVDYALRVLAYKAAVDALKKEREESNPESQKRSAGVSASRTEGGEKMEKISGFHLGADNGEDPEEREENLSEKPEKITDEEFLQKIIDGCWIRADLESPYYPEEMFGGLIKTLKGALNDKLEDYVKERENESEDLLDFQNGAIQEMPEHKTAEYAMDVYALKKGLEALLSEP